MEKFKNSFLTAVVTIVLSALTLCLYFKFSHHGKKFLGEETGKSTLTLAATVLEEVNAAQTQGSYASSLCLYSTTTSSCRVPADSTGSIPSANFDFTNPLTIVADKSTYYSDAVVLGGNITGDWTSTVNLAFTEHINTPGLPVVNTDTVYVLQFNADHPLTGTPCVKCDVTLKQGLKPLAATKQTDSNGRCIFSNYNGESGYLTLTVASNSATPSAPSTGINQTVNFYLEDPHQPSVPCTFRTYVFY